MLDVTNELLGKEVTVETDDGVAITGTLDMDAGDFIVLRDDAKSPLLINIRYIRRLWLTVESPESA